MQERCNGLRKFVVDWGPVFSPEEAEKANGWSLEYREPPREQALLACFVLPWWRWGPKTQATRALVFAPSSGLRDGRRLKGCSGPGPGLAWHAIVGCFRALLIVHTTPGVSLLHARSAPAKTLQTPLYSFAMLAKCILRTCSRAPRRLG